MFDSHSPAAGWQAADGTSTAVCTPAYTRTARRALLHPRKSREERTRYHTAVHYEGLLALRTTDVGGGIFLCHIHTPRFWLNRVAIPVRQID